MAGSEDDMQQSAIAGFAPIELPHPARLGEAAAATPDEQTDLDLKQEFFRYLDSCVAHRVTETKEQYAKDLAEALAARDTANQHAQELQRSLSAIDAIFTELAENLQHNLKRNHLLTEENLRSCPKSLAIMHECLSAILNHHYLFAGTGNFHSYVTVSKFIASLGRAIERVLDTISLAERP